MSHTLLIVAGEVFKAKAEKKIKEDSDRKNTTSASSADTMRNVSFPAVSVRWDVSVCSLNHLMVRSLDAHTCGFIVSVLPSRRACMKTSNPVQKSNKTIIK